MTELSTNSSLEIQNMRTHSLHADTSLSISGVTEGSPRGVLTKKCPEFSHHNSVKNVKELIFKVQFRKLQLY